MTFATKLILVYVVVLMFAAWRLDRRIVREEGGYDLRNPWHYPSTYLFLWSCPVTASLALGWWLT